MALVTGGGTGIGKAIALGYAREGADLIITQRRLDLAEKTSREIEAVGRKTIAVKADISKKLDLENLVKLSVERFGRIDILVNNAGIFPSKPFLELTEEDIDRTLEINLKGTILCTQAVVREMVKRRQGKIINISSLQAICGMSNFVPYACSKGGINALTRALAVELGPYGICVNCIVCGFTLTEGTEQIVSDSGEEFFQLLCDAAKARSPLGRVAYPEDYVGLAIYLASEESNYMTAECIALDGGGAHTRIRIR